MKYAFYENKKRDLFLDRIANIFQVKRKVAENFLHIDLLPSLRFNPLAGVEKTEVLKELEKLDARIVPIYWCEDAYYISSDKTAITSSELFETGAIYIQNASSFVPVLALNPQEEEDILDMCAAPGGKATHIAAKVNNNAHIWINDVSYSRVKTMEKILEKYKANIESTTILPAEELQLKTSQKFDKILLDAQCSGEGMINLNHPRALQYWSIARIRKFQALQLKMIETAYQMLKPGGTLVYSTCTYAPEENEFIINDLLEKHEDIEIVPIEINVETRVPGLASWDGKKFHSSLQNAVRVIPTEFLEGFFVCKLQKTA
jgi:tRNA (cytosine49-C5)-methyltransferase